MSKTIKIQSTKNGFKVVKTKAIANEKYIIADETGKPLNKLKFVQKDKNLEIYTDVNGKEQQIVTLEDYYAPDMNASVVGLNETSEELAYVYNANDGWSYLELPDTSFGFATPLLGLGAAGAAGVGIAAAGGSGGNDGNGSNTSSDTTPPATPATAISNYDDNVGTITNANSTATTTDDTTPGFNVGAIPADANSIVLYVDGVEVAATYDALNETLTPNTPLTEGTHSITYAYKDASGNTSAQSPAFSLTVNTAQTSILAQIGNEGDNPDTVNSVVTAVQLATLSGITGVVNANEDAYQDYIDANPDSFSSPASVAEVQAMITAVNTAPTAGQSVIDLGSYGKLIAGVQVEGKWYYYWDRSGDGTNANTGSLNGGDDYTTHDVLDGIFKYDINGNLDTDSNTDNTYRYATLNGVKVALPTYGGANATATDTGFKAGTAVSNNTTTDNPTYNDLLAIWDSYNGTTTEGYTEGTPSGWTASYYWSATTSTSGHADVYLYFGYVNDSGDTYDIYVALQVL